MSEIGAHTANVTFDWNITGTTADQIKNVCFVVAIERYTSMTPIENRKIPYAWGADDYTCGHGLNDSELTDMSTQEAQAAYNKVYGVRNADLTLPDGNGGEYLAAKVSGQEYFRYNDKSWDGKSLSGTYSLAVIGLLPNSTYGNTSSDVHSAFEQLWDQGVRQTTPVDLRYALAGLQVELKDGSSIDFDLDSSPAQVPDFTTTAEPAGTTEDKLTPETKDNVTVDNGGKVEAGKSARIYINNLKESCKADGVACFWYGYIYSNPTKLTGPDGSPFLTVKKDDAGKYYVDAFIPETVADGEHKIALTDGQGNLQGWTPVTVGEGTPAEQTAQKLYGEWGYPIVDEALQGNRGKPSDGALFTQDSWNAYKTAFQALAGKLNDVVKGALNNTDRDAAVRLLALQPDLAERENELRLAQEALRFADPQPVYRLYDAKGTTKHLYTIDKGEYERQLAKGWRDETATAQGRFSVAPYQAKDKDGNVPEQTAQAEEAGFIKPVYRLYQKFAGPDYVNRHFYTTDKAEYEALVAKGWRDEGVAFYSRAVGGATVYRTYSPSRYEHLFTSSKPEADKSVSNYGYRWDAGHETAFNAAE